MSFVTCSPGVAVDKSRADELDEQFGSQSDSLSRLQVNLSIREFCLGSRDRILTNHSQPSGSSCDNETRTTDN